MKFATFVLSFFVALSAVATALLVYEERITLHRNVVLEANLRALIKVVEGATTHCNIVCAHKEGPNQAACRVRDRAASDQLETGAANLRLVGSQELLKKLAAFQETYTDVLVSGAEEAARKNYPWELVHENWRKCTAVVDGFVNDARSQLNMDVLSEITLQRLRSRPFRFFDVSKGQEKSE